MKNIVARKIIREFWEKHPDSETALKTWYKVAMEANWQSSHEVKALYRSASIIGENRIVFNICGNKYRLIAMFNYEMQWGWIRFVGKHKEYDKIDALRI